MAASLLLLTACTTKTPPVIAAGSGGLQFVTSSNILNANKETLTLGRQDSIKFVFTDSLSQDNVIITDANGNVVNVIVQSKGDSLIIIPVGGAWNSTRYSVNVQATLANGTPASFILSNLAREIGLWLVQSNVYDVAAGVGFQAVPANVGTIAALFDQAIARIDGLTFTQNGTAVGITDTIIDDTVKIIPQIDSLNYAQTYTVSFRAYTSAGLSNAYSFTFHTAGSAFVPTASNVQVLASAVGKVTTNFGIQQTLWVAFSDTLDPDQTKIAWATGSSTITLFGGGTANKINATATISGDTLKVTPNASLKGVTNGATVGFRATVYSVKGLTYTVEAQAYLTANDIYIVSTNVQLNNGLFRPFKVIGDSLVVTFSKKVIPDSTARIRFRVNNYVNNYTVAWSADSMTATIKNIDTLATATYGGLSPYQSLSTTTMAYDNVSFNLTAVDGEATTVAPSDPIQIHTEYGITIVNSNILDQHLNTQIPVAATELAMDTLQPNGVITVVFNRAVDTTRVKAALPNSMFMLYDGTLPNAALPITLSFSADAQTVTLTPVLPLQARKNYYLKVIAVPGQGIDFAPGIAGVSGQASGVGAGNLLVSDALRVYYVPIDISQLQTAIALGKFHSDSTLSTVYTAAGYTGSNLIAGTTLSFEIKEAAWNKHHADSVGHYEYRVRKRFHNGTLSGWSYGTIHFTPATFDTSIFAAQLQDNTDTFTTQNLNMSTETFWSDLLTPNGGTNYSNAADLFNLGDSVELQVRVVVDDNGNGLFTDPGEQGPWSNSLVLADNVAPCDPINVAKASMGSANTGGVSVTENIAGGTLNLTAQALNSTLTITLRFPEDMNVSTAPTLTQYSAVAGPTPTLDSAASFWTDARTYRFVFVLDAGSNYNTAGSYYAVSVAGLKDASGVPIITSGDVGQAANGTTWANARQPTATIRNSGDAAEDQGSLNVAGLKPF